MAQRFRTEKESRCQLCGTEGHLLYADLQDRLFGASGRWALRECGSCGLLWLSPRPTPEGLAEVYRGYFTHEKGPGTLLTRFPLVPPWLATAILSARFSYRGLAKTEDDRGLGSLLGAIPSLRDYAGTKVMFLHSGWGKRLLDVGCGDGTFLARLRALGWETLGVEVDPEAVSVAREKYSLQIIQGSLEEAQLPETEFDVVTAKHVLEHVPDSLAFLAECHRVLRPGGRLVVLTPNVNSLGHRLFRRRWAGLDPPRHLYVFSEQTLAESVRQGPLYIEVLRTMTSAAPLFWAASSRGHGPPYDASTMALGLLFSLFEEGLSLAHGAVGEELLLIARKGR